MGFISFRWLVHSLRVAAFYKVANNVSVGTGFGIESAGWLEFPKSADEEGLFSACCSGATLCVCNWVCSLHPESNGEKRCEKGQLDADM
ncbi:hypothetical protein EBH_0084600 [Eimeria brunetti]|uniref:Secreted protein n=1 Tax=Eimeria brunetti TaxID=51314 RepID=U6LHS4_9EIME|nr:hypothetical protein EBH_0084600 [Eimeria brunetti]